MLAKVGVHGVDPDFATLFRTLLIAVLLIGSGKWTDPRTLPLPLPLPLPLRTTAFLSLSALATGASWVCHSRTLQLGQASQVAPVDKLSVALVTCVVALFAFVPRTH